MKKLTLFSIFLAAVVIILGAYTRLTDAGLGCPDWPGCYGNLTVPLSEEKVAQANAAFPERPVEAFKAWNEMIHRYFAGTLGLCVLAIAIIAIRQRDKGTPVKLPLLLLGLIIFQAALGMWTVTLNLLPVVVMGHLLGGFSVLSCLFILYLRLRNTAGDASKIKQAPIASAMHDQALPTYLKPKSFSETLNFSPSLGLACLLPRLLLVDGLLPIMLRWPVRKCRSVKAVGRKELIWQVHSVCLMQTTMSLVLTITANELPCT